MNTYTIKLKVPINRLDWFCVKADHIEFSGSFVVFFKDTEDNDWEFVAAYSSDGISSVKKES